MIISLVLDVNAEDVNTTADVVKARIAVKTTIKPPITCKPNEVYRGKKCRELRTANK